MSSTDSQPDTPCGQIAFGRDLAALNRIAETLNRAVNVREALTSTLVQIIQMLGLQYGWILLPDPSALDPDCAKNFVRAAAYNLPPSLAPEDALAWCGDCECERLFDQGQPHQPHQEVTCSRMSANNYSGSRTRHTSVPLCSGERTLGILNLVGQDHATLGPHELALLQAASSQVAAALERDRLYDSLRQRHAQEEAMLLRLSQQLLGRLDLNDVMRYVVASVRRLMHADAAALLLPDAGRQYLVYRATEGWRADPAFLGYQLPASGDSAPVQVFQTREAMLGDILDGEDAPDWLRAEGFRRRALVPLVAGERSVGVLMMHSRNARWLDEDELRFLRLMANQAALAIEKARLHEEEVKRQRLIEELEVASEIQHSFLPQRLPQVPGWGFAVHYQPARLVSGDFYDCFALPGRPGQIALVIADVAGKGVPAALFMALSRTTIRSAALREPAPADVLIEANALIRQNSQADSFVTAVYGVLDTQQNRLLYASGGHTRPLRWHAASGLVDELAAQGTLLGMFDQISIEEQAVALDPGDMLVFYTDGVTDARNMQRQRFGEERLYQLLASAAMRPGASARQVLEEVLDAVQTFADPAPQTDDITLFVIRRE